MNRVLNEQVDTGGCSLLYYNHANKPDYFPVHISQLFTKELLLKTQPVDLK